MANRPKEPGLQELISRIVRVEAENTILKEQIADLLEAFEISGDSTDGELARINDALWPVVHKVFPRYLEMQARIDKVIPPCSADPRADRRRKAKTG